MQRVIACKNSLNSSMIMIYFYHTTVIILCISDIILPLSNSNGSSITMNAWPSRHLLTAFFINTFCIWGCVMALSFFRLSASSKTNIPSFMRLIFPSSDNTCHPNSSTIFFHAASPGSTTAIVQYIDYKNHNVISIFKKISIMTRII